MKKDQDKTKEQLIDEMAVLRQQVAGLETLEIERKLVEIGLQENEERYRDLFENTSDLIQSVTPDGHFVYVNRAWREALGYTQEEIVRLSLFDIIHPDSQAHCMEAFQHVMSGESLNRIEADLVTKGGEKITVEGTTSCRFKNGKPITTRGIFRDITERKRVEKMLRTSEEKYRQLAENAADAIWAVDMNMRPAYISSSIVRLLGYSVEEAMAKRMEEIFTPASFKMAMRTIAEELAIEKLEQKDLSRSRVLEVELKRKDGSTVPVELGCSFLRGADTQPIGILAIARNITGRKKAEEKLKESEEKLHLMFESVTDGITISDLDGKIVQMNEAVIRMHGYNSKAELIGRSAFELIAEKDYARAMENMKRTLDDGFLKNIEYTFLTRNGSEFPAELSSAVLRDASGELTGFIAVTKDITERKKTEKALRESEEKLSAMLNSIGDHVSMLDEELNITWANETAKKIFGNDIIGKKCYEAYHRRTQPCEPCLTLKTFRDGGIHEHDTRVIDKDGEEIYFHCIANVALKDKDGKPATAIEISRDITERKQAEERKVQFINMLCHELNTPLTPILSSGKLLVEELKSKGEIEYSLAKNILVGAHSLRNHLDELMDLVNGEVGLLRVNLEPLDIGHLIQMLGNRWSTTFADKGQEFQVEMESPPPYVLADEERTNQILSNLLSNANKFTPKGSRVTLRVGVKENVLVIEVEDNGPGILPKRQGMLFQPYSHWGRSSGLGIGLSISKMLAELQGGKVWCDSQPGKGSTFGFSLPLAGSEERK